MKSQQGSAVIFFLGLIVLGFFVAFCFPQYYSERTYQANTKVILKGNKRAISAQLPVHQVQNQVNEWLTSSSGEVSRVFPHNSQSHRPDCITWYKVKKGDTQWAIASRYSKHLDKKSWLKSMRWVSRKGVGDTSMSVGESVCVEWGRFKI